LLIAIYLKKLVLKNITTFQLNCICNIIWKKAG